MRDDSQIAWDSPPNARGPDWEPTASETRFVDGLAALIARDDVSEIRARYAASDLRVQPEIVSFVDGVTRPVALDPRLVAIG